MPLEGKHTLYPEVVSGQLTLVFSVMAEEAVRCEPFSAEIPCEQGKIQGIWAEIRPSSRPLRMYPPHPEEVTTQSPSKSTRQNREFLWPYQGTLFPDKTFLASSQTCE
jgi:hypothetical protein